MKQNDQLTDEEFENLLQFTNDMSEGMRAAMKKKLRILKFGILAAILLLISIGIIIGKYLL